MKKTNSKYVLTLLAIGGIIGLIPSVIILIIQTIKDSSKINNYIPAVLVLLFFVAFFAYLIIFLVIKDNIWSKSVKKLEAGFKERGFLPTSTFTSSNGMFYIDAPNGKIAVITKFNPFVLQILDANIVENVKASNGAILGGTSCVSFCFTINGQKWKIPTFISNQQYSLKSQEVMTGLSKADLQVALINEAKQIAEKRISS